MSIDRTFIFTIDHDVAWRKKRRRAAVLFISTECGDRNEIYQAVRDFHDQHAKVNHWILIGPEDIGEFLQGIRDDPKFQQLLNDSVRLDVGDRIEVVIFDSAGVLFRHSGDGVVKIEDRDWRDQLRHTGISCIFQRRSSEHNQNPDIYHYVKTSEEHCDRFIRIAEMLVASVEIEFIAMWLLEYIDNETEWILCDTGSVIAVVYGAVRLRARLDRGAVEPGIASFGSHKGLKQVEKGVAERALIVISVSTSGRLATRVRKEVLEESRIVTVLYLSRAETNETVLCDLGRKSPSYLNGMKPIEVHPEHACPLCTRGSTPIRTIGDDFAPHQPVTELVELVRDDVPKWMWSFATNYVGTRVLRAFAGGAPPFSGSREVFVDVRTILEKPDQFPHFHSKLNKLLDQSVPAGLRRVVYYDESIDPSSRIIAEKIKATHARIAASDEVQLVRKQDVERVRPESVLGEGVSIVASGVVTSGQRLADTSQLLRDIQTNDAVGYIVGVSRPSSQDEYRRVVSNVRMGRAGPSDHNYCEVERIFLPNHNMPTAWDMELEMYRQIEEYIGGGGLPGRMRERAELLRNASDVRDPGLIDNLFWSEGDPLKLRNDFALWPNDITPENVTQADVYFAFAATIHRLRVDGKIKQSFYRRNLIKPSNFSRFSDGVAQAAILRAARPPEMEYSVSESASRAMHDLMAHLFRNFNTSVGEAATEFLIAWASGRVWLRSDHADLLIKDVLIGLDSSEEVKILVDFIVKHRRPQMRSIDAS